MSNMQSMIVTSSGDLVCLGYSDQTENPIYDSNVHTVLTHAPNSQPVIKGTGLNYHRWDSNNWITVEDLQWYKDQKNDAIDSKTAELISSGFTYDSTVFSLSNEAQKNWIGLDLAKGDMTYPVKISTKSDVEYSLVDATAVHNFYLTGVAAKQGHLDSGRALKIQVNDATTVAEVDAVVDNR